MKKSKAKVLLLEDSRLQAKVALAQLNEPGDIVFEVKWVERLSLAMDYLKTNKVDVVVTDLHLPDSKGIETFTKLQTSFPNMPIVVLTGTYEEEELAVQALQQGAQDYVMKGQIEGGMLRRILRYAIERKRNAEELRKAHDELEKRVQERTTELRESNLQLGKALEELKQTQHQLVQQERLRALGEMASGIAHDFNNALSPILGYSELMMDAPDMLEDKAKLTNNLKMINTAARDAAKVVSRLREFFRPREKNETFHPIDINNLMQQAINLTQPKWKTQGMMRGADIQIQTNLQQVPLAEGNEAELREVLTNLIFNAADAMPKGGTITLCTYPQKEYVIFEVKDTGTGMTEEVRRRCLEPFFTTKGEQGTGLGLSMVYGIIRRHNGTVDIQSEAGKGTAFSIRIPIHKGEERKSPKNEPGYQVSPLRILFVDDEPAIRNVILEYLKRDGHSVEVASSGAEALSKFYAGRFDLVITDRAMPEMSGERLAAKIKEIAAEKPIILLSGTADLMTASGQSHEPFDAIVCKPVTLEDLRKTIAKLFLKA